MPNKWLITPVGDHRGERLAPIGCMVLCGLCSVGRDVLKPINIISWLRPWRILTGIQLIKAGCGRCES